MKIDRRKKSGVRSQETEGKATANSQLPTAPSCVLFSIRNPKSAIRNAFTLVELITVIVIIMLLAGILMPTLMKAKQLAYLTSTRAYITVLENGALRYQQEKQYFPGQEDPTLMTSQGYTGSQILVSETVGITRNGDGNFKDIESNPPTSEYIEYNPDRFIHTALGTPENPNNYPMYTIIDLPPLKEARPILYYPSRLGNDGRVGNSTMTDGAFIWADNANPSYFPSAQVDAAREKMRGIIWDKRFGTYTDPKTHDVPDSSGNVGDKAYNSDTFLIFAKEIDNRDQAYSWFTPKSAKNF